MHLVSSARVVKIDETCIGCSSCVEVCPTRGFSVRRGRAIRKPESECAACRACAEGCPVNAVKLGGAAALGG